MTNQNGKGAVVLGRAMGAYSERPPTRALRAHFSCTWVHSHPAAALRPAIIVPDGAVDVVWIDGKLRIEGPDRVAAVEHFAPGGSVVGVRSRPAAARAWLGVSLSEIEGKRVPFDQFRGRDARRISDLVGEARDPLHAAQRLEYGLALAGPLEQLDEKDVRIFEIVRARRSTETGVLDELEQRLGLSERTLRRRCTEAYGYGPKTLDRILRLQRFLALACEARRLPLAVLAATVSYADQAHLTRETRALTGLTPTAIVGQLRRGSADSFKT